MLRRDDVGKTRWIGMAGIEIQDYAEYVFSSLRDQVQS